MRTSHRCPKCQGEDLLVVDPWSQPDPGSSNTTSPTQVAFRMSYFRRQVATDLELWVCAGCGYAELFAKDVDTLGELADAGTQGLRRVRREKDGGAYR
ncbi:MAG TPA: hypothetical protein RMH85_28660 [Polyangiaceae bacterium LLY-WYZ-15_(1-7)]|nr:hypothetical protein [Myxococcales bacterium]MAT27484.1 hypothetical protein [Sandaracinus sp.]HJK94844.1 hypothetical protein [Polyangiaceae bacterium LLY-WYZ-15_(1-7)]MBJ70065.1 hypothetical protein [Sandaracinus sp.]HJL02326.1 hypothetical protein [Polyangiaceae bacterium LLY-WYZ-15_(1-7)]